MVFIASMSKSSVTVVIIFSLQIVSIAKQDEIGSRVVGGKQTEIKHYPYLVNIAHKHYHDCGGSYLKTVWVLTAAHCLNSSRLKYTTCRMALTSLTSIEGVQSRDSERFILHPDYNKKLEKNDIGIIEISSPFDENELVTPVTLASVHYTDYTTKCFVPGWGLMKEYYGKGTPEQDDRLRVVEVPLLRHEECMKMYGETFDTKHFKGFKIVCAGYAEGKRDACQGDSGGPLICGGKQVGIVSFGFGCARPNMPGIYTDVVAYLPWIKKMTHESGRRKKKQLAGDSKSSSTKMHWSRSYYIIGFTLLGILSINYVISLYLCY